MRPPAFPPSTPRSRPSDLDAEVTRAVEVARPAEDRPEPGPTRATPAPEDPVTHRLKERLGELRTAKRRARQKKVGIIAGAVALVTAIAWAVAFSPLMALDLEEVEVSGVNGYITTEEVMDVLAPHEGEALARLDFTALGEELQQHYAVKDTQFVRVWPSGIAITVDARTPVAATPTEDGFAILDGDGVELGTSPEAVEGLPVISVDHTSEDLPETLEAVLQVMDALPAALLEQVGTVGANNPDEVEFTLEEGGRVIWGSPEDSELKASVLQVLLEVPAEVYNVVSPMSPITS